VLPKGVQLTNGRLELTKGRLELTKKSTTLKFYGFCAYLGQGHQFENRELKSKLYNEKAVKLN